MLTVKQQIIREDESSEFWFNLPEVKSWLPAYEQQLIDTNIMISVNIEISEDNLTFTRTTVFESEEQLNNAINFAPVPNYELLRTVYMLEHSHIVVVEKS